MILKNQKPNHTKKENSNFSLIFFLICFPGQNFNFVSSGLVDQILGEITWNEEKATCVLNINFIRANLNSENLAN